MLTTNAIAAALVWLAALNLLVLLGVGSYDVALGPVHLVARQIFKPLLYLGGAVLVATVLRARRQAANTTASALPETWTPGPLAIAALALWVYLPALFLNPITGHGDWLHRVEVQDLHSLSGVLGLFAWKQPDGFYRPLVFVSYWIDNWIFGAAGWGYHLQNWLLHAANAVLVALVGVTFGLERGAARWGGALFAVAAIAYEPVTWPGARFDVMAGFFTLLALIDAGAYLEQRRPMLLWRMLGWFALGVLCKESAYAFVPLFLLLAYARGRFDRLALSLTGVVTAALLGIRFAVLHGMGGYPAPNGPPHFEVHLKTFTSFFTRALPAPLLMLNTNVPLTWFAMVAIAAGAVWAMVYALTASDGWKRVLLFLAAALASALPAANLVDWIGPPAQNIRYLYLTSVWFFLLLASASWNHRRARRALVLLVVANALGVQHNLKVFNWPDWDQSAATGRETAPAVPPSPR